MASSRASRPARSTSSSPSADVRSGSSVGRNGRLMRTFSAAPRRAVEARSAATPTSLTAFGLPIGARRSARVRVAAAARAMRNGASVAPRVASTMRASRAARSSSLSLGRRRAATTSRYASASRSVSSTSSPRSRPASVPIASISDRCSAASGRPRVSSTTMPTSAAPMAPAKADALPPPGIGALVERRSMNSRAERSPSLSDGGWSAVGGWSVGGSSAAGRLPGRGSRSG